jgi:hypothetical protein
VPHETLEQHVPFTQLFDWHSPPPTQAAPLAFLLEATQTREAQVFPGAQSVLLAHTVKQAPARQR